MAILPSFFLLHCWQLTSRSIFRFVAIPVPDMKEKLDSQIKQVETDVDGLDKRLHYLETTAKNSQVGSPSAIPIES